MQEATERSVMNDISHGVNMDLPAARHPSKNCTVTCKYDGENPDTMAKGKCYWVRCCLCVHWFHPDCVSLPQDETEGVWTCTSCRCIADDVSTLKKTVNSLMELVRKCYSTIAEMDASHKDLCKAIKDQQSSPVLPPLPSIDNKPKLSLLVGDSLIKNIQSKNEHLVVTSNVPKVDDVTVELEKSEKVDSVYVVCGTNDCKGKDDPQVITESFRRLMNQAKTTASKVHIASIPPRTDDPEVQKKIDTVNQLLVVVANEEKVSFINNDENFTYKNNTADLSLLQLDGCHLSHDGILRLTKNLGLQDHTRSTLKPPKTFHSRQTAKPWNDVVNDKGMPDTQQSAAECHGIATSWKPPPPPPSPPRQNHAPRTKVLFQGHKHPLSNFFPCEISLYDKQFMSAEAAYQYRKALQYHDWDRAEDILNCKRAVEAKRLGDDISTDQQWWDIRQSVMMEVIRQKARQCSEFRNTLLASQGNVLVEDTVHEFWGRGKQGDGQNKLGTLLQALRSNMPALVPPKRDNQRRPRRNDYQPNRISRDSGCGFCGERGHSSDVCGHGRPIKCNHCNGFRHKEKQCWNKNYD